jgi:hypothetical protein
MSSNPQPMPAHAPQSPTPRAFTVAEFCASYRLSRSGLYQQWAQGTGPKFFKIGAKILISVEAAEAWRREREAATAA